MATYKHSTINLFSTAGSENWELLAGRFLVVDNMTAFLSSKTRKTITDFQYIKPELEISITVDLSQTFAEPLDTSYKYVTIVNSDNPTQIYCYFVKKVIWRAKSAVRFDLVMDVLNTFKEGTHYDFKDSTRIIREHKNRFSFNSVIITLAASSFYETGTITVGDSVKINVEIQGDWEILCDARVIALDMDEPYIRVEVTDGTSLTRINNILNDAVSYSEYVDIFKDSSNYYETNTLTFNAYAGVYRNIDYIQENINPILQCGNGGGSYINDKDKSILHKDWYLIYRNQNTPDPNDLDNPVECYLMPSSETAINSGDMTTGRLRANNLEAGQYYYAHITQADQYFYDGTTANYYNGGSSREFIEIYKNDDNTLTVTEYHADYIAGGWYSYNVITYTCNFIQLEALPQQYYKSGSQILFSTYILSHWNDVTDSWTNTDANNYIDSIDLLDRADAKNIKVIKLPYIPYDFNIVSNKIDVPNSDWVYTTLDTMKVLKLNDLNTKLHATINVADNSANNPLLNLYMGTTNDVNASKTESRRNYTYESKLFNSEFYRPTYVYDSFSFTFQLEKCRLDYYVLTGTKLKIYFDVTRTINSRFMFTFDSYQLRNSEESYNNFMPINRNNEEVLYNVPYINYIRSGYNYDVKNRNLSNVSNYISLAGSYAGMVASFMAPSVPLKVAGVAASIVSFAMAAKNAIVTAVNNEYSLQATLKQKEYQTASVSGSDDVDLMSIYANNRLKLLYYTPNEIMRNMLNNLFYYAGYASNRMGLPSHNTRISFDYLECDAMIQRTKNIPDDCLEELINCFKNGVTYIHYVSERPAGKRWDFAQEYENWENIFF